MAKTKEYKIKWVVIKYLDPSQTANY